MNDAPWLRDLAQVNREREAEERSHLDERWDRLSAGELTPEEETELIALAETSGEAREAYEAFRPLGPDFQASVARAIRAQEPRARVLPFRRPAVRYGAWVATTAAAAAALILILRNPASLPAYQAALSGGARVYRGGTEPSSGPPVFVSGALFTLDATPDRAVTGPLEAHAFRARGAGIVAWKPEPHFDISSQGAVRLLGTVGREILIPAGTWRIWIVVGRRGKLPPADEIMAELHAGRTRHADWQAVYRDLRVADRASP